MPDAIVTVPPHASFITEVACHPLVSGLRLNTVMPVKGSLEDTLKRLLDTGKTIYVDLKCRQLRVRTFGVPPFTEIELTHRIAVETPVTAYFSGGKERATVLEVDGNRLIMALGLIASTRVFPGPPSRTTTLHGSRSPTSGSRPSAW